MSNYFIKNVEPFGWIRELHLSTIDGKVDWRRTLNCLPCGDGVIPIGFMFNGASVGPLRRFFPKWKHPIATCRHDWRCQIAEKFKKGNYKTYKRLRKYADDEFYKDVGKGGTKWEQIKGYTGVRIGAFF